MTLIVDTIFHNFVKKNKILKENKTYTRNELYSAFGQTYTKKKLYVKISLNLWNIKNVHVIEIYFMKGKSISLSCASICYNKTVIFITFLFSMWKI